MFRGVKTLVTGCSGFLGPWLCQRLLEDGADVLGADIQFQEWSRIHDFVEQLELVELDVCDYRAVEKIMREHNVEVVFHLAAQSLVGRALLQPLTTLNTNVGGTTNVLEAARHAPRVRALVIASSDKAYGDQEHLPYLEEAPMMGRFPYDVSKSCADLIARSYFHAYKLPVAVLRCGNLYGGGDLNWSRLIPGAIRNCLQGEAPIIRSDGTLVRDFVYVEDAARAFAEVAGALLRDDTVYGAAYNVGTNQPKTVVEVADLIIRLSGLQGIEPLIENSAKGEIRAQYLSSHKLQTELGWSSTTSLEDGLQQTIAWYRERI